MTEDYKYFTVFHIWISSPMASLITFLKGLNLITAEISVLGKSLLKTCNTRSLWFKNLLCN